MFNKKQFVQFVQRIATKFIELFSWTISGRCATARKATGTERRVLIGLYYTNPLVHVLLLLIDIDILRNM